MPDENYDFRVFSPCGVFSPFLFSLQSHYEIREGNADIFFPHQGYVLTLFSLLMCSGRGLFPKVGVENGNFSTLLPHLLGCGLAFLSGSGVVYAALTPCSFKI